jgi:hypothetical protein
MQMTSKRRPKSPSSILNALDLARVMNPSHRSLDGRSLKHFPPDLSQPTMRSAIVIPCYQFPLQGTMTVHQTFESYL